MSSFASSDSQRQILALIRDFATERSQGERRVFDLRKRLQDLRSDLEASSSALSLAKLSRDAARDSLNASELELSVASASVLVQQAKAHALQDEIAKIGSEVSDLKEKGTAIRDGFLAAMFDLNRRIRKFHASFEKYFEVEEAARVSPKNGDTLEEKEAAHARDGGKDLQDKIECIKQEIDIMEKKYREKLCEKDEVMGLLNITQKRVHLAGAVMEAMKQLQDLGKQTSEAEKNYAHLGEELKKKYTCPGCYLNNMGEL